MSDYYQDNHIDYHAETFYIDPSSFLGPLSANLPECALVLDVGCGSGRDLCWLKAHGFRVMGFERSRGLAQLARANAMCEVIEGDFEEYDFSKQSADAIALVGALVHIEHEKLLSVLSRIVAALKEGGKVLLTLKQGDGLAKDDRGRTFYLWQDEALRGIFKEAGCGVVDFKTRTSSIRSGDTWLAYVLQRGSAGLSLPGKDR